MSELSFLIDLLLNHKLEKETKDLIAARIKEVEQALSSPSSRGLERMVVPRPSAIAPVQAPIIDPVIDETMRQKSMEAALRARRNAK